MEDNYPKAYKEVIEILNYVPKESVDKIPQTMLDTFKTKMDKEYDFTVDVNKSFEEQDILEETKAIFANIFRDYWATPYQKERIEAKEKYDRQKLEEEKMKKYNPEDIVAITKTADGKLVWLENGTDTVGLNHIITEHADDFLNKGITQEQIPDYIMNALENGKIVGYQGRGTGRPIYEFTYNGEIHKVAITVGNNGFIVGANPK